MKSQILIGLTIAIMLAFHSTVEAQAAKPFQLKIERFERRVVTPRDVADGYDTQIAVVLNATGTPPAWWKNQSFSAAYTWGDAKLFYQGDEKSRPVPVGPSFRDEVARWTPAWNLKIKRYEARYLFKLSDIARSKERIVLRGKISLSDFNDADIQSDSPQNSTVSFSYGVRARSHVVAVPRVSHDPKLDVTRVEIEKFVQPISNGTRNSRYDTVLRIHFHDRNSVAPLIEEASYPRLMNGKGQQIPMKYNWSPARGTENLGKPEMTLYFRFFLAATPKTEPNIFVDNTYSPHSDWPLHLRIQLRRNGRDLSGELSQSQYTATPVEVR